jgi:hypothetical protein
VLPALDRLDEVTGALNAIRPEVERGVLDIAAWRTKTAALQRRPVHASEK